MPIRERPVDRGALRGRDVVVDLGREIRSARRDRALSQEAIGRPIGVSGVTVGRIERGLAGRVSILRVAQLLETVGLELSAHAYPGGRPIRDAPHVALLTRFQLGLHPSLSWRTEVPLPIPGDRRAWDGLIAGGDWRFGVEAETAPRDAQALIRRLTLKERDGRVDGVILVLPPTRRTRVFLREAGGVLAPAFPGTGPRTLELLRAGVRPPVSAIVCV